MIGSGEKLKEAQQEENVMEEMKQGASKIMVAVRLRPMWKKEKEKGEISIVKILVSAYSFSLDFILAILPNYGQKYCNSDGSSRCFIGRKSAW